MLRFYVLSLEGGTPATAEVLSSKNGAPGQSHQDPQEMVSTNGGAGKNSVSKSARITLKVETSVEGLMPLATPDRGEEAQTESAGVGAPSDRSVTFTQEQSVESVDLLLKELHRVFKGYIFPPAQVGSSLKSFPLAEQERWVLHYTLQGLLCANDGAMGLTEPFVQFLQRGRLVDGAQRSKASKRSRSASGGLGEITNGATDALLGQSPNTLQLTRTNEYHQIHALVRDLQALLKKGSNNSFASNAASIVSSIGFLSNSSSNKEAKAKAQDAANALASSREGFVKFVEKRTLFWQRAAQGYSGLAVRVGELCVEHARRCVGPGGDGNGIRTQIGRTKVSEDELQVGDRVEAVSGASGTVMCVIATDQPVTHPNSPPQSPPTSSRVLVSSNKLVGVAWDVQGQGNGDGTYQGVRYFYCTPNEGSFLSPSNLYKPRDHDDLLFQMADIIAALDDVLHPSTEVRAHVQTLGCQLSSLLQLLASFHQAHVNSVTELQAVHQSLLSAESWLVNQEGKKDKNRDVAREQEVRHLVDSIAAEWWLASKAFGDGVDAFKSTFVTLRLEAVQLFHTLISQLDIDVWSKTKENKKGEEEGLQAPSTAPVAGGAALQDDRGTPCAPLTATEPDPPSSWVGVLESQILDPTGGDFDTFLQVLGQGLPSGH